MAMWPCPRERPGTGRSPGTVYKAEDNSILRLTVNNKYLPWEDSPGIWLSWGREGTPPVAIRMWGAVYFFPLTSIVGSGSHVNAAWPWMISIWDWRRDRDISLCSRYKKNTWGNVSALSISPRRISGFEVGWCQDNLIMSEFLQNIRSLTLR